MIRNALAIAALALAGWMPAMAWGHPGEHRAADGPARAATMAGAANQFVAVLDEAQRAKLIRPLDDDAARTDWSNLPTSIYPRTGLPLSALNETQRIALHDLLAASMSSGGYAETATIMWIDDILHQIEAERLSSGAVPAERQEMARRTLASRSSGNYWLRLFGDPESPRWAFMVHGHHFAASFTVADGRVGFTPLFLGANPQTVRRGPYAGWRVLDHKIANAFALMGALDADQRRDALVGPAVEASLFTGKGRKDALPAAVGLPAARLNPAQRTRLMALVEEFVGFASDEAAAAQLASIRADGVDKLRLAWWGSPDDRSKRFLYRIQGPSILIEYVREPEADGSPGNHVHAIVRDPRNDYGEDWLARHYIEQPHP